MTRRIYRAQAPGRQQGAVLPSPVPAQRHRCCAQRLAFRQPTVPWTHFNPRRL